MKIKKTYLSFVAYIAILTIIYAGLSPFISSIILGIIVVIYGMAGYNTLLLLPCLLYPFMFLIRIPDHQNLILTGISDIVAILAILSYIIFSPKKKYDLKFDLITGYLSIFAVLSFIISGLHILSSDIEALPQVFRQSILPVIFIITFINASYKDNTLPQKALSVSLFSFTLVGLIAFLNYINVLSIPPLFEEIYPSVNYLLDLEQGVTHGRSIAGSDLLPRINLFLGGALGSAAGILAVISIISLFNFVPRVNRGLTIVCGISLITSALLSISYSILISIIIALIFFIYLQKKLILLFPIIIIIIYYLFNSINLAGFNAIDYYQESFIQNIFNGLISNSFMSFLFGNGPKLTTIGYNFVTRDYSGDIGIFRILIEQGIINFSIFVFIIYITLKRYFVIREKRILMNKFPFIFIIIVMLLSIHTILIFTPPFYPLFALSMAGIYLKN